MNEGNSFRTKTGGNVTGMVAMVLDAEGQAVPAHEGAASAVRVVNFPITLKQLCRALAGHAYAAAFVREHDDLETIAETILKFARANAGTGDGADTSPDAVVSGDAAHSETLPIEREGSQS